MSGGTRRIVQVVAAASVALTTTLGLPSRAAAAPTAPTTIRNQADWILAAQLPDGAIAHWVDHKAVWPYLSNFAAMGLARASAATGDSRYSTAAWKWLSWYGEHQDASGFVTDYTIVDGRPVSTGDMDSTDAYAGTFLMATHEIWRATGDRARLDSLHRAVGKAVDAILATQDADGLTWAKPSWKVKYLMDQAEAAAGLSAAQELAAVLGDAELAARSAVAGQRLDAGLEGLWNPATGTYDWAVHASGVRQATNMAILYPDAMQQAWMVAFGRTPAGRGRAMLDRFLAAHPNWDDPRATARYDSGTKAVGYWAPVGWALQREGDPAGAAAGAASIEAAASAAGRAWPFTPGDAGQLLVLETAAATGVPGLPAAGRFAATAAGGGTRPRQASPPATVPPAAPAGAPPAAAAAPSTTTSSSPTTSVTPTTAVAQALRAGAAASRAVTASMASSTAWLSGAGLLVPVAVVTRRRRRRGPPPPG